MLLAGFVAVSAGRQHLARNEVKIETDLPQDLPPAADDGSDEMPPVPDADATADEPQADPAPPAPQSPTRSIDPEMAPRSDDASGPLERVAPRPPLSDLSLAGPLKPKQPDAGEPAAKEQDEWKGEPLFQPVANAAGEIESKGHSVELSGIDVVKPDETCTDDAGKEWACGLRARTAFRAFLRGRAVTCDAPEGSGTGPVRTQCRIGKEDIGQWLVENGWARAAAGGPYADAGKTASEAKKGVFGPAPDLSNLPPEPSVVVAPLPGEGQRPSSILDLSGTTTAPPAGPAATPPPGFPPAPAE